MDACLGSDAVGSPGDVEAALGDDRLQHGEVGNMLVDDRPARSAALSREDAVIASWYQSCLSNLRILHLTRKRLHLGQGQPGERRYQVEVPGRHAVSVRVVGDRYPP